MSDQSQATCSGRGRTAASLATGIVTGLVALDCASDVRAANEGCSASDGRALATTSNAFILAAAAGTVATVVLYLTRPTQRTSTQVGTLVNGFRF